MKHIRAKHLKDVFGGGPGVFDDVMEQRRGHGSRVHLHVGEYFGHFKGVGEVGKTRQTHLSLVNARRIDVGPIYQCEIGLGVVFKNTVDDVVDAYGFSDGQLNRSL